MDPIYQTAFVPPQPVVLGKRLLPLSLGHLVLLDGAESIFVSQKPTRRATAGDLAAAVWICSQKAGDLRMNVEAPDQAAMVKWGLDCRKFKFKAERTAFVDYITSSLRFPRAWYDDKSKTPVAAWQFSIAGALIESGVTRAEVWDMPVSEALALYAAIQERNGLELMTAQEKKEVEAIEREAAEEEGRI